jgi:antitoxin VapB
VRRLTTGVAGPFRPQWTSDGARLTFTARGEGSEDIFSLAVRDGSIANESRTPDIHEGNPAYSPDGRFIAFDAHVDGRQQSGDGKWEIWLLAVAGGERRRLAAGLLFEAVTRGGCAARRRTYILFRIYGGSVKNRTRGRKGGYAKPRRSRALPTAQPPPPAYTDPPAVARVFQSGNSQAVRLPREFRVNVDELQIIRRGSDLILREKPRKLSELLAGMPPLPDDFPDEIPDSPPEPLEEW